MDVSERAGRGASREYRDFVLDDIEFRANTDANTVEFEGVASVVDMPYTVDDAYGSFQETIAAGAFDRSLKNGKKDDVFLHVNHRWDDVPMASRMAGSLRLVADPNLRVQATLDGSRSDVQILRSALEHRIMREMSIGFTVPKDKQTWAPDYSERTIRELKLMEVSVVKKGANPYTSAAARSFDEFIESLTEIEMDEADLRRAIAYFESRLLQPEAPVNEFAERDQADKDRLLRRKASFILV